jgi:aminoglycoside phosphotransferase (APT) family kinase protein
VANSPVAEHSLDEAGVRALLRAHAPGCADLPLTLFAEGWDNAMWRLGAELVVRLPRRALSVALITNEHRALPEIGPPLASLGIRTPIPVIAAPPTDVFPWPWSVVPWIDGTAAIASSRTENGLWAPELAAALLTLHSPAPADAPLNPVRGRELRTRDDAMRPRLAALSRHSTLRDYWAAGLAAPPSDERVWIHGDLHPGNILVHEGRLAALIDFGDVTVGDPAYDLAAAWMLFDTAGRETFRAATDSRYDDATWVRARAWAAYIALVLLTQSDDRPDHLAVGRSTAEALGA